MAGEGVMLVPPYAPGTVAVATVRGVKGVRVFRYNVPGTPVWFWVTPEGFAALDHDVPDTRPLVVLDLAPGDAEEIVALLRSHAKSSEARCLKTADQIEAQVKPPRIPEPGLWGVVEARLTSAKGATVWTAIRTPGGWRVDDGGTFDWSDLIDPVLVREGVSG